MENVSQHYVNIFVENFCTDRELHIKAHGKKVGGLGSRINGKETNTDKIFNMIGGIIIG